MKQVTYRQGNTHVFCDGEKVVVKNNAGKRHVKANVEQIFGMGEYDKLSEVAYLEHETKPTKGHNPQSRWYEMQSGYIPERAKNDLAETSLPGIKQSDIFDMDKL